MQKHCILGGIEISLPSANSGTVMSTGGYSQPKNDERVGCEAACVAAIRHAMDVSAKGGYINRVELAKVLSGAKVAAIERIRNEEYETAFRKGQRPPLPRKLTEEELEAIQQAQALVYKMNDVFTELEVLC